jgi:hypothetical protein
LPLGGERRRGSSTNTLLKCPVSQRRWATGALHVVPVRESGSVRQRRGIDASGPVVTRENVTVPLFSSPLMLLPALEKAQGWFVGIGVVDGGGV